MFLPISPNPPRGTTCKVLLFNNSSYYLLLKVSGYRLQVLFLMPFVQFRYLPRSSSFGPTAERYRWSVLKCSLARRAMSCGVTASMRAEISSGVRSSAPVMTLRPTRFILAEVLSRASSVELLSCCLVQIGRAHV